ncbi:MAG: DUF1573 domain-containing protein [Bacteroidales bacterium]|nr:DUF1573 domain-containing protein [Bacteroidales bacterium]MDY4175196.1 DUF1573 domain-containing protein [Bacteroidales bacterium]
MRKIFAFAVAALFCVMAFAQKPTVKFETESHDFGEIQEKDGPVSFVFKYSNTGTTPLIITQVNASCGCTTPEWTRKPLRGGENGEIKVTFNPANRPGVFNKTITVYSNSETPTTILRISGKVLQRPKTIEDEYPVVMDSLRLENQHIPFTKVLPKEVKKAELKVVNTSSVAVTPTFINVPAHVTIESQPATIQPGQKALFVATYDAEKKNDWGYVTDRVYVIFDGQRQYKNQITLSASIEEDFSDVKDEDAPVLEVNERNHDFGEIQQGTKAECDFIVTNTGKSNLIIRKVKASCGCTAVTPQKTVLAKGESTAVHVAFDSRGKSGRQSKTITVISNDPKNSNIILRIQSIIVAPGKEMK